MTERQQNRLLELVASLSDDQRNAVEAFIQYLREKDRSNMDVRAALGEFVREHSELLRRLSQ